MRDIIALRRTAPQESRWLVAIGKLTCGLPSRLVLYRGAMLLLVVRGAQSDQVFLHRRHPYCEIPYGELPGSIYSRNIGMSNYRAAALVNEAARMDQD